MTQKKRMAATKQADALFSKHIRERDGGCKYALWFPDITCNGNLQCSHFVSRRYRAVRWDPFNAAAACAAHHLYVTHHPLEHEAGLLEAGIEYEHLKWIALNDPPMDPKEVITLYKDGNLSLQGDQG